MKITSKEVRRIFKKVPDKLLFSPEWTIPTKDAFLSAVQQNISDRKIRWNTDTRINKQKTDCTRNVMTLVAMMSEFDWSVGLAQIDGHALFFGIVEPQEVVLIESLDGGIVDQEIKINLIEML